MTDPAVVTVGKGLMALPGKNEMRPWAGWGAPGGWQGPKGHCGFPATSVSPRRSRRAQHVQAVGLRVSTPACFMPNLPQGLLQVINLRLNQIPGFNASARRG